ncbi:SDR family NAD(P)-dependent oxidoreductase [Asticcacaulis tiandongensis]|uniref:SDR family NAD(P)-dependent oxidoreductase n=1 Tax=Asticcacaulis tiandongensis TaxID=2565365 RepID=UPI0015E85DCB|nr:SDR family NAD(P)-dependent oxidoreductase [Asticcacaulis tiandongensis]
MTNLIEDNEATRQRVWFITDADCPYGFTLTQKVLSEGGFVLAVSAQPERLRTKLSGYEHALVCIGMDTSKPASVTAAVQTAISCFGQIDVLVNNTAVCGLTGAVETTGDSEVRRIFDVNLFGMLNVTRTILPCMRDRRQGHVINVSAMPEQGTSGLYNAARRAIDGVSEALSHELEATGIQVTIVAVGNAQNLQQNGWQGAVDATLQLVDATKPPLRLVLGQKTYERTLSCLEKAQTEMRNWARISLSSDRAA